MMNYFEGDNIGSLRAVDIIRKDLPIGMNPVQLPYGADWTSIPLKDEGGILQLKTTDSDNGPVYTYSGSFLVPNMRDEVDQVLLPLCGKEICILRLTDMNGRLYIIGTPDAPVTLNIAATTGQKYSNENGSTFNFTVDQTSAAVAA